MRFISSCLLHVFAWIGINALGIGYQCSYLYISIPYIGSFAQSNGDEQKIEWFVLRQDYWLT